VPGLTAPGGPGYWESSGHAPNEHIRLADLSRAVRFNCYLFERLAST
jgi:acetylornithine deacetylase/succinyl-diaminopimelate desuccinylase-like protein